MSEVPTLTVEDLERLEEERIQRIYTHCEYCREPLGDDYREEKQPYRDDLKFRRYHKRCYEQLGKDREMYRKRSEELDSQIRKIREEVKAGERPTTVELWMVFQGRIPDFKRFREAVKRLAKEYNLEPWKEVE